VAVLGFAVWGPVGWPYFQLGVAELYYRSGESMVWGEGGSSGVWGTLSPEAEVFSLNYMVILDLLSMIYNVNLRFYVDTMNKCK